jgi:hypothetical protein
MTLEKLCFDCASTVSEANPPTHRDASLDEWQAAGFDPAPCARCYTLEPEPIVLATLSPAPMTLVSMAHYAMDRGFLRNASGATALEIHFAYLSAVLSEHEVDGCEYDNALHAARNLDTNPPGLQCWLSDPPVLKFPYPDRENLLEWVRWYDATSEYPDTLTHGQLIREIVHLTGG